MTDVPLQFRSPRRRGFFHLGAFVAPRTSTETRLAGIWCRTLNLDEVGINDRYEDLGGDSLLAASIFAEIEECFAVVVPIATIANSRTIAQLAQVIDLMREAT
jgi:enterobactin synthetase component F